MPEILPPPPATPGGPPPYRPGAAAPAVVPALVGVLADPARFYASVRGQTGLGPPLRFAAVMGLAAGVIAAALAIAGIGTGDGAMGVGAAVAAIVLTPVMTIAFGSFVGGAIVHLISMIAGGKGGYEQSVRIASYGCAVIPIGAALAAVPLLGIVANLYGLHVVAIGVVTLHLADRRRTLTVAAVLGAVVVLVGITGFLAARTARDETAALESRWGGAPELQREVREAASEARRAAEEMRRAQER